MRHKNVNRKFGREKNQRHALMRSLTGSLILHGKMKTTVAKAKEIRPFVEKLVTRAKKTSSLHARRLLQEKIGSTQLASRLIHNIAPKYTNRQGGYTRVTKLSDVRKDGSTMAIIEFV